jgi:hypothetical protein
MNEGVKVLIERLKTNPEDFEVVLDEKYKHGMKEGRFYWVSEQIRDYLRIGNNHLHLTLLMKEDLNALVEAFKEKHQQEFTDKVMKDLFKEEETPSPAIAGGWMSNGTTISPLQGLQGQQANGWTDPRIAYLANQQQAQQLRGLMDSTNITSVSKGGTGTTATTGLLGTLTGIFK